MALDERVSLVGVVHAVRQGDLVGAGERVLSLGHVPVGPALQLLPHVADEHERDVLGVAHLQELPDQQGLELTTSGEWSISSGTS